MAFSNNPRFIVREWSEPLLTLRRYLFILLFLFLPNHAFAQSFESAFNCSAYFSDPDEFDADDFSDALFKPYVCADAISPASSGYPKFPSRVPRGSQVYLLGSGLNGGSVYRVELRTGVNESWKKYKTKEQAKKDFRAFQILEEISKETDYQGFKVLHPISIQDDLLRLEYKQGETLRKIQLGRSSPALDQSLIQKLNDQWKTKLQATIDAILRRYPNMQLNELEVVAGVNCGGSFFDRKSGQTINFFFHPGNILVEPFATTEMWVMDPY